MASPQVAGVVACLAEHWPRVTQDEIFRYFNAYESNSGQFPWSQTHLATLDQIGNAGSDNLNYSITNSGNNYVFSGDATGTQPDLTVTEGDVLNFSLNVSSIHPFYIVTALGGNNSTNEVSTGTLTVGSSRTQGDMIWDTRGVTPGTYYYVCDVHGGMNGEINVQADTNTASLQGSVNRYLKSPKIRKVPSPSGTTYVGAASGKQQTWPRLDNKFRPILDGGNVDEDMHPSYMVYPRPPIWSRKLN
jgi:plastocyanin